MSTAIRTASASLNSFGGVRPSTAPSSTARRCRTLFPDDPLPRRPAALPNCSRHEQRRLRHPGPRSPARGAILTMGITVQFVLSPGDSASVTSVFNIIPVPEPSTAVCSGCGLAIGLDGQRASPLAQPPTSRRTTPTNGFHPLYLILLLPILAASGTDLIAPIHASAILLSAVAVLTGLLIFRLTQQLAGPIAALIALAVWAVSPYFTVLGINGLETGLAMLFAVAALCAHLEWVRLAGALLPRSARGGARRRLRAGGAGPDRPAAAAGRDRARLAAGRRQARATAPRARPDRDHGRGGARGVATVGSLQPRREPAPGFRRAVPPPARSRWPMAGWICRRSGRPSGFGRLARARSSIPTAFRRRTTRMRPRSSSSYSYWSIRCWRRCGSIFHTTSGPGSTATRRTPRSSVRRGSARRSRRSCWPGRSRGFGGPPRLARGSGHRWAGGGLSAADLPLLHFLLSGSLVLLALPDPGGPRHAAVRHLRAARNPAAPLAPGRRGSGGRSRRYPAAARGADRDHAGLHPRGCPLVRGRVGWIPSEAGKPSKSRIAASATLGAFQAGIFSWFGERDVVNLDGKMNPAAARALADHELAAYIASRKIDYVLDWPWMLRTLCTRHLRPGEPGLPRDRPRAAGRLRFRALRGRASGPRAVVGRGSRRARAIS